MIYMIMVHILTQISWSIERR